MLLYTVQFLCSVVAAFARLARALRKAMASVLCSPPVSLPATTSPASSAPLSMWRKAHPALGITVGDALRERDQREAREQLLIAPAVDAFAACNGGGGAAQQVEPAKKAARGARKRPSMLVIPVAPEAVEVAAGWGTVVAEKEAEVEVEGEGFWLASRRGARHAMEDAYGVIAQKLGADSQLVKFFSH